MFHSPDFAVGQRVRVCSGGEERSGLIVEYFGDAAGYPVTVGATQIAEASRRWAIDLDDGMLLFVDTADLQRVDAEA
jgi:hypothetical protein